MEGIDEDSSVYWQHMKFDNDSISPFQISSGSGDAQYYLTNGVNIEHAIATEQNTSMAVLDAVLGSSSNSESLYGVDFGEFDLPVSADIVKEWFGVSSYQKNVLTQWKGYVDDIVYGDDAYASSMSSKSSEAFYDDSFVDWQFLKDSGLLVWTKVFIAVSLILLGFVVYLRNQPSYRMRSRRRIRRR